MAKKDKAVTTNSEADPEASHIEGEAEGGGRPVRLVIAIEAMSYNEAMRAFAVASRHLEHSTHQDLLNGPVFLLSDGHDHYASVKYSENA